MEVIFNGWWKCFTSIVLNASGELAEILIICTVYRRTNGNAVKVNFIESSFWEYLRKHNHVCEPESVDIKAKHSKIPHHLYFQIAIKV